MPMTTPATRATFAFTGLLVALAGAGCEAVTDLAHDLYEHTEKGAVPPPKDPPPPADTCGSSAQCGASLVCSVELGVCNAPPGCGPGVACPAVCYGTCVPRKDPPPPQGECATDADCRTFSNYCDGCACDALAAGEKEPACSGTIVRCFADPCGGQAAFCKAGQCVLGSTTPPTPGKCDKRTMGGESSCKSPDVWKKYAHDDCVQQGLSLSEISLRQDCGGGNSQYVDYVCCTQ